MSSKAEVEVYTLQDPVDFGGRTIDRVSIRKKAKVKDWKPRMDPETGQLLKIQIVEGQIDHAGLMLLAPRLCELLDAEWDEFSIEDMFAITGRIAGFLSASQEAGKTPSRSSQDDSTSPSES